MSDGLLIITERRAGNPSYSHVLWDMLLPLVLLSSDIMTAF